MMPEKNRYQYTLVLNVRMLAKWGLSYSDGAVFAYILNHSDWAETVVVNGVEYRWISMSTIAQQVPLSAPSERTLRRTMRALRDSGLVETRVLDGKNLLRVTDKGLEWNEAVANPESSCMPAESGPHRPKVEPPGQKWTPPAKNGQKQPRSAGKSGTHRPKVEPPGQKWPEDPAKNGQKHPAKNGHQLVYKNISIQGIRYIYPPSHAYAARKAPDGVECIAAGTASPAPKPSSTLELELTPPPKKKRKRSAYSEEFEAVWKAYPKRAGSNPKKSAYKAYVARIREGVTHDELMAGVERYKAYAKAERREGTEYIMHAATFFGPNERWRDEYAVKSRGPRTPVSKEDFAATDYGPAPVFKF